jgi:phage tail tape-measure protein
MCPVCTANMALMAAGATSSGGLAFILSKFLEGKKETKIGGNKNEPARDGTGDRNQPPKSTTQQSAGHQHRNADP